MSLSQSELQRQLNVINAELAKIQAELDKSTRGTPRTRQLSSDKKRLEAEKTKVEQQLNNITVTSPTSVATAPTSNSSSQESLKVQLTEIDAQIAEKETQLLAAQRRRDGVTQQLLNGEIERLKRTRARVLRELNSVTTVSSEPAPVGRPNPFPSVPAPPPQTNQGTVAATRAQQTTAENFNVGINQDWRVRLYLAENSNYLYNDDSNYLLSPLRVSNGVIFPYTPQVQVAYAASYDAQDVAHSNYKLYFYKNSSIENISITTEFTAQDTYEANYLLAVIHFFKSVTKMFYGQDQNPINGSPPPICYLDGFGTYQFNKHPLLITNFQYTLPNDVDYIRATVSPTVPAGTTIPNSREVNEDRLNAGGVLPPPKWTKQQDKVPTYVPTKIQIAITAIPVISRKDISDNFSLKAYANGSLLLGRDNKNIGAGIW